MSFNFSKQFVFFLLFQFVTENMVKQENKTEKYATTWLGGVYNFPAGAQAVYIWTLDN